MTSLITFRMRSSEFKYDPNSGDLYRAGKKVGCKNAKGYLVVRIGSRADNKLWLCHRLIWVGVYGEIPSGKVIDHINMNRSDNRLSNLRLVTHQQNMLNTKAKGVHLEKSSGRYIAYVRENGKHRNLGRFATESEALAVRQKAVARLMP